LLSVYNIPLNEEKSLVTIDNIEFGRADVEYLKRLSEPEIIITDYPINDADWFGAGYSDGVFTSSGDGANGSGPAWISTYIDIDNPVNYFDFDAEFISENGSEGYVGFLWDGEELISFDERYAYLSEGYVELILLPTLTKEETVSLEGLYENLTEDEAWALALANSTPEELMSMEESARNRLYLDYRRETLNRYVPYGSYEFSIRVDQYTEVPVSFKLTNPKLSYRNVTDNVIFPHCHKPCAFEY